MRSSDWFEKILNNFASKSLGKRVKGIIVVGMIATLVGFTLLGFLLFSNQLIKVAGTIDVSGENLEIVLAHNPFEKMVIPKKVLLTFEMEIPMEIVVEDLSFDSNRNVLMVEKPKIPLSNQSPCMVEFRENYKNLILSVVK